MLLHFGFPAFVMAFLLLLPTQTAWAQEGAEPDTTAQPVRITMRDGSDVVGTIEREDEENLYFRTASGVTMTIPKEQVRSTEALSGRIVDGAYLRVDPNRTRLLFAPTARPLRSGQGYFADYLIFFPFVAVGVADVVSLAGGISLFPGLDGQVLYVAPKVTVLQGGEAALAAGLLAATFIGGGEGGYGGLVYGIGTLGESHRAVSVGLGFAFSDGEFSNSPALVLGGEYQLSNNIKLLTENYLLPAEEDGILVSAGIRFFGDRLAADLGLLTIPFLWEGDVFPFVPLVSFAYNFGR